MAPIQLPVDQTLAEYEVHRRRLELPALTARSSASLIPAFVFSSFLTISAVLAPLLLFHAALGYNVGRMTLFYALAAMAVLGPLLILSTRWRISGDRPGYLALAFLIPITVAALSWGAMVLGANFDFYRSANDGEFYIQMAQSFIDRHAFYKGGYISAHFGPLYPLYLSVFYLFSRDLVATQAAVLVMGAMATSVVFAATRRLYGAVEGVIAVALLLGVPSILYSTSLNMEEFLVAMLYCLIVYSLRRSLDSGDEKYVVLAGICAGLAYLAKSSTGYFFLIAGLGGFLWRFRYAKWEVFKDRNYLGAVAAFGSISGIWVIRNVLTLWRPRTGFKGLLSAWNGDYYFNNAFNYAFYGHLELVLATCAGFLGLMLFFLVAYSWPFWPHIWEARVPHNREVVSLLVLATFTPIIISAPISAMYYLFEHQRLSGMSFDFQAQIDYFVNHGIRYMFFSLIPMAWLAFESKSVAAKAAPQCFSPKQD